MNTADKNTFKVPDGYFNSLTYQIMDKIHREEVVPSSKDGFKLPEGYLDTFPSKILQKLENESKEIKVIPLKSYKNYYYAIASIAAVFLMIVSFLYNSNTAPLYSDLANSDIEHYFEFNELELSSYDLAEILPIQELDLNDILENSLDNENIIDYLDTHIEDFEELNMPKND